MLRLTVLALALFIGSGLSGPRAVAGGPEGTVADFVAGLGQKVVQVLSEHEENRASRHDGLRDLIEDALSIRSMGKTAIGSYWGRSAPEQQDRFIEVFRRYLINYCVGLLDEHAPDSFTVISTEPMSPFDTKVTTRVRRGIWTLADIGWVVREIDGAHRIVDIVMKRVSIVTTYSSEFRSVTSRNGLDRLILALARMAPDRSADADAAVPPEPALRFRRASSP